MRTLELKIYKFDELSDEAKQVALNHYRDCTQTLSAYDWAEDSFSSLRAFCETFNVELKDANFSQYSDVNFSIRKIDDNILELSGIRLRTYLLNNFYNILYKKRGLGKFEKRPNGRYGYKKYSKIVWTTNDCPFTGYCMDESLLMPIRDFIKWPTMDVNFDYLLNDCINSWIVSANHDCEYQDSDEAIIENFEANDYEFLENGKTYKQ